MRNPGMDTESSIYYHRYTLRSRGGLNAASARTEHEGALLRIGEGFGCVHPWPELGDAPLDEQLKLLAQGKLAGTPLLNGASCCAAVDGAARRRGVSLYQEKIPESHWLVLPGDDPAEARELGFDTAKIKGGTDSGKVRKAVRRWREGGFRIRLDFNECIEKGGFLSLWETLSDEDRAAVEFVEDPEEWTEDGWCRLRRAGVPLAMDHAEARWRKGVVLVCKPARSDAVPDADVRFLVTSYMDHALGQMFAGWRASALAGADNLLKCGLLTHRCFEPDEFFERVRAEGPRLLPVEGTGLGFDDLLENLPWKRLE